MFDMVGLIVLLAILLVILTLGITLLLVSGRVGEKVILARPDIAPLLFYMVAIAELLVSFAFTGLFVASQSRFDAGDRSFSGHIGIAIGVIFVVISFWCGWLLLGLGRSLSHPDRDARIKSFRKRQIRISVVGWLTLLVVPLAIFRGFLIMAILLVLAVSLGIVACMKRRIRQGSMLSLLAISADRQLPLAEEVGALASDSRGKRQRRLRGLANALAEGVPLSEALAQHDEIVPAGTVLAASAGEQTGTLGTALRERAEQDTESLQRMYLGTPFVWLLVYFGIVFSVAQSIILFEMYYIVPKFKKIFEDFGTELPNVTMLLISISDLTVRYFYIVGPAWWGPLGLLVVVGLLLFRRWNFIKLPWVSRWMPREDTAALLRALAYIVQAKKPLPSALASFARVGGDHAIRRRLTAVRKAVESGDDCWQALSRQQMLTRSEVALLDSAERVGNLPFVLRQLADTIEARREYRLLFVLELLRPVVIFLLAIIVAVFCLSFFMPLIKLINDLS